MLFLALESDDGLFLLLVLAFGSLSAAFWSLWASCFYGNGVFWTFWTVSSASWKVVVPFIQVFVMVCGCAVCFLLKRVLMNFKCF